jgi:hypothetical protein
VTPLELARFFHDAYEALAPHYGYETRADTRAFDPGSKNGRLMVAVAALIIHRLKESDEDYLPQNEALQGVAYPQGFQTGIAPIGHASTCRCYDCVTTPYEPK